jgi:hypothetical protein
MEMFQTKQLYRTIWILMAKRIWGIRKGKEVTIRYASTFDSCFCDAREEKEGEIMKEVQEDTNVDDRLEWAPSYVFEI